MANNRNKASREEWESQDYTILQFIPTDKYQAVFAHELPDGSCELVAQEIEGVAVARVDTHWHTCTRHPDGNRTGFTEQLVATHNQIVGVMLYDTGFKVADEASNFAGLTHRYSELHADDYFSLREEYRNRLRPEFTRSRELDQR